MEEERQSIGVEDEHLGSSSPKIAGVVGGASLFTRPSSPVGILDDLLEFGVVFVLPRELEDGSPAPIRVERRTRKPVLNGSLEEAPFARDATPWQSLRVNQPHDLRLG